MYKNKSGSVPTGLISEVEGVCGTQGCLAYLSEQMFNNTKVKEEHLSVWQKPLPRNQLDGRCVASPLGKACSLGKG